MINLQLLHYVQISPMPLRQKIAFIELIILRFQRFKFLNPANYSLTNIIEKCHVYIRMLNDEIDVTLMRTSLQLLEALKYTAKRAGINDYESLDILYEIYTHGCILLDVDSPYGLLPRIDLYGE